MYQPSGDDASASSADLAAQQAQQLGFFGGAASSAADAAAAVAAAVSGYGIGMAPDGRHPDDPGNPDLWRMDKDAIYSHPLMPLLTCLLEKCELATSSPRDPADTTTGGSVCSAASFKEDLSAFIKVQETTPTFYRPNPELDQMMILAIRVLRIHLLELEKVHELCDNFCARYVNSLKQKLPMEVGGDERANSTRPTSSLSSPTGTAGSSNSPAIGTPMASMPMYPGAYDNHMNQGHDPSQMGHPSTLHGSIDTSSKSIDHPHTPVTTSIAGGSNGATGNNSVASEHHTNTGNNMNHDQGFRVPDNSCYQQMPPNTNTNHDGSDYKPNLSGLDGGSDGGDESLSMCGSLPEDGGRDSVSSEGVGNGSDAAGSSHLSSNGKRKVPKVFSKEAINKFRSWLFQNLSHPYPSEEQKKQLAADTNLTILQVNNWFINARRRIVQPMIDSNNRKGTPSHVNVFKNRRRKDNGSPGPSPDATSASTATSAYSMDSAASLMPMGTAAAAAATYPFANPYAPMPNFQHPAAFNPNMFMPMNAYGAPAPWCDLSGGNPPS